MATRKSTIASETPATDVPFVETVAPKTEAPQVETPETPETETTFKWSSLIKGEASWKRFAVAAVASLATTAAVGVAGNYIVGYLTVTAALMTSSVFIATIIYMLSILIMMYVAYRASTFTYLKIIDKTVDKQCAAAWGWASNLFTSKKVAT